jgi:hypothetical protein
VPSLDKDTFNGWLVVMMKNIGEAKMSFPQEVPWLIQLETAILSKSEDPARKLQELGLTPGPPPTPGGAPMPGGGGGMPPGMMGGMPPGPPPGMPPGVGLPGMGAPPPTMGGPPMPAPDEMAQFM